MARSQTTSFSYRWQVLQRVVAATVVGYGISASVSALLAQILPIPDVQAVAAASMLSFTFYTLIIIGCFTVKRLRTLWTGLILCLLFSAGLNYWLANLTLIHAGGGF